MYLDSKVSEEYRERGINYEVLGFYDDRLTSTSTGDILRHVERDITDFIEEHPDSNICLDLSGIRMIDSSFLGMFLSLSKRLRHRGKMALGIHGITPDLYEIFDRTKTVQFFDFDKESRDAYDRYLEEQRKHLEVH